MLSPRAEFEEQMKLLNVEFGQRATEQAYLIFGKVIAWLRKHGHGDVRLSAIDHIFASKFRGDTVFSVDHRE